MCLVPLVLIWAMAKVNVKVIFGLVAAIIACGFGQHDVLHVAGYVEALYSSWSVKAMLGRKISPQKFEMSEGDMMLEQEMSFGVAELYAKDLRVCGVAGGPGFFESNGEELIGEYCKAVNLQADSTMCFEGAVAAENEDMVIYDLKASSVSLVNFEDFVDYGMANFLAVMNKKIPYFVIEKILNYVIVMLQCLVEYAFKNVNYIYFLVDHFGISYEMVSWAW